MIALAVEREEWPFASPFRIARGQMTALPVIRVDVRDTAGNRGRGEAAGVDYDGETIDSMIADIEAVRADIEAGADRAELARLMAAGGARNAVDCALWDLEAKARGVAVWTLAGLAPPATMLSAVTIGLGSIEETAEKARALRRWPLIKIKLDAAHTVDTVELIRGFCPGADFIVDPNQAWSLDELNDFAPHLARLGVKLIEQPLPRGSDDELAGYTGPVSIAADESCSDLASVEHLRGLYDCVNIKLDKCGGLTEALRMRAAAQSFGLATMVGCMAGTSLAMAPAALAAQGAAFVDLDGPLLHSTDREHGLRYNDGMMSPPLPELWG